MCNNVFFSLAISLTKRPIESKFFTKLLFYAYVGIHQVRILVCIYQRSPVYFKQKLNNRRQTILFLPVSRLVCPSQSGGAGSYTVPKRKTRTKKFKSGIYIALFWRSFVWMMRFVMPFTSVDPVRICLKSEPCTEQGNFLCLVVFLFLYIDPYHDAAILVLFLLSNNNNDCKQSFCK